MSLRNRVSSFSSGKISGTSTPEMRGLFQHVSSPVELQPESTINMQFRPDQVLFRSSSLALLRTKDKTAVSSQTSAQSPRSLGVTKKDSLDLPYSTEYIIGARVILEHMHALWKRELLCDVILHTDSGDLQAHKIALGAYSPALDNKFNEFPSTETMSINLSDIPKEAVRSVLQFLYTTDIVINEHNVGSVLYCASELGIEEIIQQCVNFLTSFNEHTVLEFYDIAQKQGLEGLRQHILHFIIQSFEKIVESPQFALISQKALINFLSDDNLGVSSELAIFRAIVRWVNHERSVRLPLAAELLECVRFQLITAESLSKDVETVDWMFVPRDCHDILFRAYRYHALRSSGSSLVSQTERPRAVSTMDSNLNSVSTRLAPQQHYRSEKITEFQRPVPLDFNIPKRIVDPVSMVMNTTAMNTTLSEPPTMRQELRSRPTPTKYVYATPKPATPTTPASPAVAPHSFVSPQVPMMTSTPFALAPMPQAQQMPLPLPIASPATRLFQPNERQVVIAVGGIDVQSIDPDVPGRYVHQYDPLTNQWTMLAMLPEYTHHHGLVVFSGLLYVVGGCIYDNSHPEQLGKATNAVQVLDLNTSTWHDATPMKESRGYHGVAVWGNRIYAIGGEDQHKRKLDTVECYDTAIDQWIFVARLPGGPRIGMGVAVLHNELYVVGGYSKERTGNPVLSDVECFDLMTEKWVKKSNLPYPRCHSNLVVAQGRLFLAGGRTRTVDSRRVIISVSAVEEYDRATDTWHHVTDMAEGRHDAGCSVVGSRIFLMGGMQSPDPFCKASVECFDISTRSWMGGVDNLPYPCAGIGCATVQM